MVLVLIVFPFPVHGELLIKDVALALRYVRWGEGGQLFQKQCVQCESSSNMVSGCEKAGKKQFHYHLFQQTFQEPLYYLLY